MWWRRGGRSGKELLGALWREREECEQRGGGGHIKRTWRVKTSNVNGSYVLTSPELWVTRCCVMGTVNTFGEATSISLYMMRIFYISCLATWLE